ncbi:MAG: NAD(P)-dependent alcohol dehydrogenase [Anaerolineae bacterium]|nr:MAG: alcohol dehydrogenase [Chloroflexi bacterium OLB13]MBW7880999.1 NAD(P)-dependent alcohol dehydrogenase [Anaerolineae bacterium]
MKAIYVERFTAPDSVRVREVEKPIPTAGHVLIKVHATSVNYNTVALVTGKPFIVRLMTGGMRKPRYRIPGNDVAGRVEAVGANVSRFKRGDAVFGDTANVGFATFAEYVVAPESVLEPIPAGVSFEDAASAPEAGLVALQGLRDAGHIEAGQRVLIVGASGGIGTFAVQIAKHLGAEVTAVCSTRNAAFVRSIGADHVIDYTREDFASNGQNYDLVLSTAGYRPIVDYRRVLAAHGRYVSTGGSLRQIFEALLLGPLLSRGGKTLRGLTVKPNMGLAELGAMIASGAVRPVIEQCYPLEDASAAFAYYAQGRTRGKLVITIARD